MYPQKDKDVKKVHLAQIMIVLPLQIGGMILLFLEERFGASGLMLIHLSSVETLKLFSHHVSIANFDAHGKSWSHFVDNGLYIVQLHTLIMITLDRVLAVKLLMRYRVVVTRKKACLLFIPGWILGICYSFISLFASNHEMAISYIVLDSSISIFFIVSYTYIILKIKSVRNNTSETSTHHSNAKTFRYHVPLIIVLSYACFYLIPDLRMATRVLVSKEWLYVIWDMILIANPLTYMFGIESVRHRLLRIFTCSS